MEQLQFFMLGASGHAKVVFDALLANGISPAEIQVTDDNPDLNGKPFFSIAIGVPAIPRQAHQTEFHVAIGHCGIRRKLFQKMETLGSLPRTIAHPKGVISGFAMIDVGAFIAALAVVGPAASVGRGVIINHGAIIDHDCSIGSFSHIAPNATLGGAVVIGEGVLIGAGATVLPGVTIGDGAVIGAGAVVIHDVSPGTTLVGVPAVNMIRRLSDSA